MLAVFCPVILAFLLTGCGGEDAEAPPGATESEAVVTSDMSLDDGTGGVAIFEGDAIAFYKQNGNEIMRGTTAGNGDGTIMEAVNGKLESTYTGEGWTVHTRLDNGESVSDYASTIVDKNTLELPNGDYEPTLYIKA